MIILFIILKLLHRTQRGRPRTVTRRTITRSEGYKPIDAEKLQRQAEKQRREQFKRIQAAADLVHYKQVKADLLKAYDAAKIDGDGEKQIRKRIAYDNAIRRTEKQIEKAAYDARTGLQ